MAPQPHSLTPPPPPLSPPAGDALCCPSRATLMTGACSACCSVCVRCSMHGSMTPTPVLRPPSHPACAYGPHAPSHASTACAYLRLNARPPAHPACVLCTTLYAVSMHALMLLCHMPQGLAGGCPEHELTCSTSAHDPPSCHLTDRWPAACGLTGPHAVHAHKMQWIRLEDVLGCDLREAASPEATDPVPEAAHNPHACLCPPTDPWPVQASTCTIITCQATRRPTVRLGGEEGPLDRWWGGSGPPLPHLSGPCFKASSSQPDA